MTDREKVIKSLECLSRLPQDRKCAGCAYFIPYRIANDPDVGWCDSTGVAKDALALLREQEPVKPIEEGKRPYRWFRCGNCEEPLYGPWNYCQKCGRKVKWDET